MTLQRGRKVTIAKPQSKDNCTSSKTPVSRQSPQGKKIESSEESISTSPKKLKRQNKQKLLSRIVFPKGPTI